MFRREFVQLAHTFKPEKHSIGGWYVSEKLDGMRAYWDGGLSRGTPSIDVPWANTLKDKDVKISTGLWSRYGKVIFAPDFFLDQLPGYPLDGELYLGPGKFQEVVSIVKRHVPDQRWNRVRYVVFDSPPDASMFGDGKLTHPMFKAIFQGIAPERDWNCGPNYSSVYNYLRDETWGKQIELIDQTRLSMFPDRAIEQIYEKMDQVLLDGGEGLMVRRPLSLWTPIRSHDLLKVKTFKDSEAEVIGYIWGEGKLEGLMGSLIVRWRGKIFNLSGFTDFERELEPKSELYRGQGEPGSVVNCWESNNFPVGSLVTFKYRELTNDGMPKEARYFRQ